MASQTPLLTTHRLSKAYGRRPVVVDVDIAMYRGEVLGLLGPNGAGKTTTIRMLLGLLKPTRGRIKMFGLDLARHRSAILARVGAMIEGPTL